jgi:2-phospho-L-lactate guanylyltransferase
MSLDWVAVVPVKALATAKSRLGATSGDRRRALAGAFAADTVLALRGADAVRLVVVVCADPTLSAALAAADVQLLDEPVPGGLNRAAATGIGWAASHHGDAGVLVVQSDLPALRPRDIDTVLHRAGAHPRTVVADRDGIGTTMLTGLPGDLPRPSFGAGSLARHLSDGAVLLDAADLERAGRDVDTAAHLSQARLLGVGPATGQVLRGG